MVPLHRRRVGKVNKDIAHLPQVPLLNIAIGPLHQVAMLLPLLKHRALLGNVRIDPNTHLDPLSANFLNQPFRVRKFIIIPG